MCLSAAASGIFRLNDGVDHCHGGSFPGTMPTIKIRCYTSTSALGNHTVQAKSVWEIHMVVVLAEKHYYVTVFAHVVFNVSIKGRLNAHNSN